VYFHAHAPLSSLAICRDAAVPLDDVERIVEQLVADGLLVRVSIEREEPRLLHADYLDSLVDRVARALDRLHKENPILAGVSHSQVAGRLGDIDEPLLNALLAHAAALNRIVVNNRGIRLATFQPKLSDQQRQLLDQLIAAFASALFEPPTIEVLAKQHGAVDREVQKVVKLGVAAGELAHIDGPLYMHAAHEQAMRELVGSAVLNETDGLTIAQIRDLLGTSRKYVVPMCEYLDRIGVTARKGDRRVPGQRHAELFAVESSA